MFVMTAKISKTKLLAAAVVLIAVVLVVVLLVTGRGGDKVPSADAPAGATNNERIAFLATYGWSVNAEPKEIQKVRIPDHSDNRVFARYNELQRSQDFDLSAYRSMRAFWSTTGISSAATSRTPRQRGRSMASSCPAALPRPRSLPQSRASRAHPRRAVRRANRPSRRRAPPLPISIPCASRLDIWKRRSIISVTPYVIFRAG